MSATASTGWRQRVRADLSAAALASVSLAAAPAAAGDVKVPVITVSEPAGFSDLTREQPLMVDVYFGGVYRGEANVRVAPGTLTFVDPAALLRLFPDLRDNDALMPLLEGQPLATNAEKACGQGSDRNTCGRLSPETVGIIFDRDHFRVDVFLNPRFLSVHDNVAERYLPPPGGGVSAVNAIGALFSGQSGAGGDYYNLHDHVIVGNGERRLRADLSLASQLGFEADSLAFEWDRPELRYSAGELWAHGNEVSGRRKLLGAGIETQIDTRLDKDQIFGSPVVVFLERRARVDVVRDGRVLSSAIYEAGNQQIDTADLPDGSYDIVLRIAEAGQPAREERRFFTKTRRIPSLGRTDYYAFGGMLVSGAKSGSLAPSSHPYAEAGVSHRLSQHWALEGDIQATDRSAAGEAGATLITSFALIRAAAVADTTGTYGGFLQLASSGNSRVNFNLDVRDIHGGLASPGGVA
ncbi:MAG: TcfC E-set like domain-containing protein, partial [Porphyrobacter sp.]|nr:TcfC E-set like domain-containing protein [Porphyrobacter sp.]